jgi:hypothetical protein
MSARRNIPRAQKLDVDAADTVQDGSHATDLKHNKHSADEKETEDQQRERERGRTSWFSPGDKRENNVVVIRI